MAQAERERERGRVECLRKKEAALGCNKACPVQAVHLAPLPLPPTLQVNGLTKRDILQGKSPFHLQNHVKSLTGRSSVYVCMPSAYQQKGIDHDT
jgi:hypothetical protein